MAEANLDYEDALKRRLTTIRKMGASQGGNPRLENGPPRVGSATPRIMRGGGDEFERFVGAISGQESGGRYNAMGINVGGDRAHGKYQIMGRNIPSWSRAALGRSVSPQEFLRDPRMQEAVARHKLQEYYRKYGAEGAAVAWYSGEGNARKYLKNRGQGYGARQNGGRFPSINGYAQAILRRMGMG